MLKKTTSLGILTKRIGVNAMPKDNSKKNKSILDEKLWDEAAEIMERNQKGHMADSNTSKEQKGNEKEEQSILGKLKDWFN